MLIDTHCHLEKKEYDDLEKTIEKIFESDTKFLIVSGYDLTSSEEAVNLAHRYKNIYASVGFHPSECNSISNDDYIRLEELLKDSKTVAIGEIGLDYHYDIDNIYKQKKLFKRQLEIAEKVNKPVIIHNRESSSDLLDMLSIHKVRGVIHCFSENEYYANKFIELGFLLGIGGVITFKNSKLKDVIKDIPIDKLVLETDSPYLSPEPFRGTKNDPSKLEYIARALATIKDVTYSEVAHITSLNAASLFDFNADLW